MSDCKKCECSYANKWCVNCHDKPPKYFIDIKIKKIHELQATLDSLQAENKKLRKIIALSEDNSNVKWVKPKPKLWGDKHG
jgi:hypothetical protein